MVLLGEKLKKLRIDRRLNQSHLAEMMGLATSAISSYESCSRRPSYEILIKYARIFHVSTDYFSESNGRTIWIFPISTAKKRRSSYRSSQYSETYDGASPCQSKSHAVTALTGASAY